VCAGYLCGHRESATDHASVQVHQLPTRFANIVESHRCNWHCAGVQPWCNRSSLASRGLAQLQKLATAADTFKKSPATRRVINESSLPLLVGGGGGRRLALAGRWLATRCILADEQGGRGGLHAWWPALASSDEEILSTPHLTGSGRLLMARRRLLLLRCGGHVVRRGWLC
jgi:hypothetical protein